MLEMTDIAHRRTNGPSRMTIREIADLAGVSIATVSRVLNGRDDVADETRELVRRVVQEHGYTVSRSARSLSAGRTGLIGVLVPLVYPVYFSAILSGTAEALYEHDMRAVALADKAVWKLMERRSDEVVEVRVPGQIPRDVNTREDYEAVLAESGSLA